MFCPLSRYGSYDIILCSRLSELQHELSNVYICILKNLKSTVKSSFELVASQNIITRFNFIHHETTENVLITIVQRLIFRQIMYYFHRGDNIINVKCTYFKNQHFIVFYVVYNAILIIMRIEQN